MWNEVRLSRGIRSDEAVPRLKRDFSRSRIERGAHASEFYGSNKSTDPKDSPKILHGIRPLAWSDDRLPFAPRGFFLRALVDTRKDRQIMLAIVTQM